MARTLESVNLLCGITVFVDRRLNQLRNVNNPHDYLQFSDPDELDYFLELYGTDTADSHGVLEIIGVPEPDERGKEA